MERVIMHHRPPPTSSSARECAEFQILDAAIAEPANGCVNLQDCYLDVIINFDDLLAILLDNNELDGDARTVLTPLTGLDENTRFRYALTSSANLNNVNQDISGTYDNDGNLAWSFYLSDPTSFQQEIELPARSCNGYYQYLAGPDAFGLDDVYDGDLDSIFSNADIGFTSPFTDNGANKPGLNSTYGNWGAPTNLPAGIPGASATQTYNEPDVLGAAGEGVVYTFRLEGTPNTQTSVAYADGGSHDVMLVTVENDQGVILAQRFLDGDQVNDVVPGVIANGAEDPANKSGSLAYTYPASGAAFLKYHVIDLGGGYGTVLDGGCVAPTVSITAAEVADGGRSDDATLTDVHDQPANRCLRLMTSS